MRHVLTDFGLQPAIRPSLPTVIDPDEPMPDEWGSDGFDLRAHRAELLALYPGLRSWCDTLGLAEGPSLGECCLCPRWAALTLARAAEPPAAPPATDWSAAPITELVCHIAGTHHRTARSELGRLQWIVDHLSALHQLAVTTALRAAFMAFRKHLLQHFAMEENGLFPLCIKLADAALGRCVWQDQDLASLIVCTAHGHGESEHELRQVLALAQAAGFETQDPDLPVLVHGLTAMLEDLLVHTAKESVLLIPAVTCTALRLHQPKQLTATA